MRVASFITFAILLFLVLPLTAQAVIYKYKDERGQLHFVDDPSKIPAQYRQQTAPINEQRDTMTREEYEALQEERAEQVVDKSIETKAIEEARLDEKRRAYQTPIMVRGNRVMIPVEVAMGNREAHLMLLLDTGATTTVLHREALQRLDLPQGEKVTARVAGGKPITSEKIQFKYIEIGPFREQNAYAMVIDSHGPSLPFDGMIGMDFLKEHPYRIDYENEMLTWDLQ